MTNPIEAVAKVLSIALAEKAMSTEELATAAIAAYQQAVASESAPAPQPRVKPLVWGEGDNGIINSPKEDGIEYHISKPCKTWNLILPTGEIPSFQTLVEAKRAAQADYQTRILSALESAPAPTPAGWKLVPVEPTKDWLNSMLGGSHFHGGVAETMWRQAYSEIIRTAPTPEAENELG